MWNTGRVENIRGIARFPCDSTAFLCLFRSIRTKKMEKVEHIIGPAVVDNAQIFDNQGLFVACKTNVNGSCFRPQN